MIIKLFTRIPPHKLLTTQLNICAGLLDYAVEKAGSDDVSAVLAIADGVIGQLVACGHALRVYFQAAFAGVDAGSSRAVARNALRLHLLRGRSGCAVQVDDFEFLSPAAAGEDGAVELVRRSSAPGSFDRQGKSGYVSHAWDASHGDYLTAVRPCALLLYLPSSLAPGGPAGAARCAALYAAEVHQAVMVESRNVFLLMGSNPGTVTHGLVHAFVLAPPEAPVTVSAGELSRITATHAVLANLYAEPGAANAPATVVADVDAAAGVVANGGAVANGVSTVATVPVTAPQLNWAPESAAGSEDSARLPPMGHRFKAISAYDATVSSNAGYSIKLLQARAEKRHAGDKKRQLRYMQRDITRTQEKAVVEEKIKAAVIGGPVKPREVRVGPIPTFPDADTRRAPRKGPTESERDFKFALSNADARIAKKSDYQGALQCLMGVAPMTLPWNGGAREREAAVEAREFDLGLVLKVSEIHDRRFDAVRGHKEATEEKVAEIVGDGYLTIERIVREFAPSMLAGDGIIGAPWPWDRSAADLATPADLLPVPRPEDDFLFQVPRVYPASTGAPAPVVTLAMRLLRLGVNDRLALALLTRYFDILASTMADWESGRVKLSKKDKDLRDRIGRALEGRERVMSRPEMLAVKPREARDRLSASPDAPVPTPGVAYPRADTWSLTRFQLRMMGPHMPRPMGRSDPRVPFRPDDWQRRLLNIVDDRENAMVVAVTSAGKTFVCFRAMEQVLHEGNDGVVVYVGPSATLVEQVASEAGARFETAQTLGDKPALAAKDPRAKPTEPPPGEEKNVNVAGVLTREKREDVTNSQVVAATPESLEATLTSAVHGGWARRIKWVIFDEVHNIVSPSGHEWERLLLAVDAPILALSATVGGVDSFQSWLAGVVARRAEQACKRRADAMSRGLPSSALPTPPSAKLHLVTHMERWNGLNAQIYVPHEEKPGADIESAAVTRAAGAIAVAAAAADDGSVEPPQQLSLRGVRFFQPVGEALGATDAKSVAKANVTALPGAVALLIAAARADLASGAVNAQSLLSEVKVAITPRPADGTDGAPPKKVERRNRRGDAEEEGGDAAAAESLRVTAEKEELKASKKVVATKLSPHLERLHPVAAISRATLGSLATPGPAGEALAREIAGQLLPEDAIALYDTIAAAVGALGPAGAPAGVKEGLAALEPHAFFAAERAASAAARLTMRRAGEYAGALMRYLGALAGSALPAALGAVEALAAPIRKSLGINDAWVDASGGPNAMAQTPERLGELLVHLKDKAKLPAIVFNTDQGVVEGMARRLGELLVDREKDFKRLLIDSKRRDAEEKARSANEMVEDLERTKEKQKRSASSHEEKAIQEAQEMARSAQDTITMLKNDPEYVDAGFTFAGPAGSAPSYKEMRYFFPGDGIDYSKSRYAMLARGIGVHHAALPASYRRAVEFFFRTGQVGVVFATDTLAQGINMPCRSVVLAGTSPDMNSLLYRQMAGRAGRRGFDLRGDVIHFAMPAHALEQLALAPLPPIAPTGALEDPAFWGALAVKKGDALQGVMAAEAALAGAKDAGEAEDAKLRLLLALEARAAVVDTETRMLSHQQPVWGTLTPAQRESAVSRASSVDDVLMPRVKPLGTALNGALGNAGLLRKAAAPNGKAVQLPSSSLGLLPALHTLGPSALAVAYLLQRGAIQDVVDAARAANLSAIDSDNGLLMLLTKLVGRAPAFRKEAPAEAGGDLLALVREEAAASPGSMRSGRMPPAVQEAVVAAHAALGELGSAVPGMDARELLCRPPNAYLLRIFSGENERAVARDGGVTREDIFAGAVALINTCRAVAYVLGSRAVEAGIVRLTLANSVTLNSDTPNLASAVSELLRDCEVAFHERIAGEAGRLAQEFDDELMCQDSGFKTVKRVYAADASGPPRPTTPFDEFHRAFLEAVTSAGTISVAREKATPAQMREVHTALALFGLASRFRGAWQGGSKR